MYGLWGYRAVLIGEPWLEEEHGLDDVHGGLYIKYARFSVGRYTYHFGPFRTDLVLYRNRNFNI
jgi:hypothetical protein